MPFMPRRIRTGSTSGSIDGADTRPALAIAAAWVAFVAALLAGGEVQDLASFAAIAAGGAALVVPGFAAAWRCRTLSQDATRHPARMATLSLVIGLGLGVANLAANWTIAEAHPTFRALLSDRVEALRPVIAVVASPVVEEVGVRLFLMSVTAWVVWLVTKRPALAFAMALVGSALVFALLHLDRPMPADATLANYYRAALLVKYTLAGLPMGWLFWRWGLPSAILCHAAANATHLVLQNVLF